MKELNKLPDANMYPRKEKIIRIMNEDGVIGYRVYSKCKKIDKNGAISYFWDSSIYAPYTIKL
jgi:hypothetical protein